MLYHIRHVENKPLQLRNTHLKMWKKKLSKRSETNFTYLTWNKNIIKIDSITQSFCLHYYVQNGLSYSGKETRPTLCLKGPQARLGINSLGTNKYQLLHRIQSGRTITNLQY